MENTIISQDKIIVNKLKYGPKLPTSLYEIPWLKFLSYVFHHSARNTDSNIWENRRMPGYSEVNERDIILFNHPLNRNLILIKRCIAKPNDSLQIANSKIIVNNVEEFYPKNGKRRIRVYYNNLSEMVSFLSTFEGNSFNDIHNPDDKYFIFNITNSDKNKIIGKEFIDSVVIESTSKERSITAVDIRQKSAMTIADFGPFVIPSQGLKINLNIDNFQFYEPIINRYEGDCIQFHNNSIQLKGQDVNDYTFKNNYYFVLGDNRYESSDSRDWGLIPESVIIGHVAFVIFPIRFGSLE